MDDTVRSKEALEKASFAMMEELRAIKSKMENQASDFTTIALDLRNKSRKLEEDAKIVVSQVVRAYYTHNPECVPYHVLIYLSCFKSSNASTIRG